MTRSQGLNLAAGVAGRVVPFSDKVRVWVVAGCIPQAKEEALATLGLREHLSTPSGAQVHSWKQRYGSWSDKELSCRDAGCLGRVGTGRVQTPK